MLVFLSNTNSCGTIVFVLAESNNSSNNNCYYGCDIFGIWPVAFCLWLTFSAAALLLVWYCLYVMLMLLLVYPSYTKINKYINTCYVLLQNIDSTLFHLIDFLFSYVRLNSVFSCFVTAFPSMLWVNRKYNVALESQNSLWVIPEPFSCLHLFTFWYFCNILYWHFLFSLKLLNYKLLWRQMLVLLRPYTV